MAKVKKVKYRQYINYTNASRDLFVDRYIGHHKVIRYADGLPVYSNLMPPLLSPAFAYSEINHVFRGLQHRPLPSLLNIALTDKCNANCEHCSFFNDIEDPEKQVMSPGEVKDLIRQSQDLGVSIIGFVGGEPLMYPEWRDVFSSIDKQRSSVIIFTNGWYLAESAKDLKACGVNGVYASLDASAAQEHDRKRGLKGLFDRLLVGVAAAKKADMTVGFSCCLEKADYERGELDKIVELGRQHGVHEVLVFDAIPVGRLCSRDDLYGHQEWVDQMIAHVKEKYNSDDNYPGVLIYNKFTSHTGVGCDGGTCYFYASPYGEIFPCDFYHKSFGCVRDEKLYKIWDRMTRALGSHGSNWNGCWAKQRAVSKPPENQPENTPEARHENTPETRPENTTENQPETRPENTPETRPENMQETRPEAPPAM